MSTFTEKIYSEFSGNADLHCQSLYGTVLPEERWTLDATPKDSLLELIMESEDLEKVELNLRKSHGLQVSGLGSFLSTFDHHLDSGKTKTKTSPSTKKDQNALKHLGFSSPEQDLKTLLSLERQSIKRAVIQSHVRDGETKKRFKLLLFHLAESAFDDTEVIRMEPKQNLFKTYFSDVILPIQAALQKVKIQLLVLSQTPKDESLELFLSESPECQEIYNFESNTYITQDQMELDLICRGIAITTQSAQVLVRFASLTGNVTYLIMAIKLLLKDRDSYLLAEQVTCASIRCVPCDMRSKTRQNKIFVSKYNLEIEPSVRELKLNSVRLQIYSNIDTGLLEIEEKDQHVRTIKHFQDMSKEQVNAIKMCFCSSIKYSNDPQRLVFVFYNYHSMDSEQKNFHFDWDILDTVTGEWSKHQIFEEIWPQHVTELIKEYAINSSESLEAIRIWGSEVNKRFVTLQLSKLSDTEELPKPDCKLVTIDLKNRCSWVVKFDSWIGGLEIIESRFTAAVIVRKEQEEELVLLDLLSGTYAKQLQVGKRGSFQVKIQDFIQDQEFGKDLPKDQPKKQEQFAGHWLWIQGKTQLVLNFSEQVCRWSNGDEGTFSFNSYTLQVTVNKSLKEFANYLLSDDGYLLVLETTEDPKGWPLKIKRCVDMEKPRQLDTIVNMAELELLIAQVRVACQFDLKGGSAGKRIIGDNLIDPETHPWCKWFAADCDDRQSWVLFDMVKEVELDGVGFTSANDDESRDPQYAEVHYMMPSGKWVYLGAVKMKFSARNQTVTFGFKKAIRTKALIFNLGKYKDSGNPAELQLGQIKLLQDPNRFYIEFLQQANNQLHAVTVPSAKGASSGSMAITNLTSGKGFSIAMSKYPLAQHPLAETKEQQLEAKAEEYFGFGKSFKHAQRHIMTPLEWAFYLAQLVDNHTLLRQVDESDQLKVRWLHKQPTDQYFNAIANLFIDESKKSPILECLHRNIADNLNVFAMLNGSDLCKLISEEKYRLLVQNHSALKPSILNYYRKASSPKQQSLSDFVKHFGEINYKVQLQLKFKATCEQILNTGDLTTFIETWQEFAQLNMAQQQVCLLLSVENAFERLKTEVVSYQIIRFLVESCSNPNLNSVLAVNVRRVMLKVTRRQFLKHVNLTKHTNFDHKGYLVTQSELLSGGINDKQIHIFSQETHKILQQCSNVIGDESLQKHIGQVAEEYVELWSQIDTNQRLENQNVYYEIIHSGKNQIVDDICSVLQKSLTFKGGLIARQSQAGQETGMKLVRAAFASIIKLQSKEQFQDLKDELDLMNGEDFPLEECKEREDAIFDICIRSSSFNDLLKLWISATKMRSWLSAKIQSVSQKFSKRNDEGGQQLEDGHLAKIYKQIIDKAELLIKIDPPKQQVRRQIQMGQLQRTPSYIPPKFATIQTKEQIQARTQIALTEPNQEVGSLDACVVSVLSCLQSPVLAIEIQNQIENSYLEAIKKYTGLTLLQQLTSNTDQQEAQTAIEVVNVLSILQKKDGMLSHYLDGINGGCNLQLESKIRAVFFEILETLANRLASTVDHEEAFTLVYSFQWAYLARDFDSLLQKVDIFNTLTRGSSLTCQVAQNWCKFDSPHPTLAKDLMLSFKDIFMTIIARVSDPAADNKTQLKTFGNENLMQAVPKLVKVRSQLDENSSSLLIDSALRQIFRYFDTFKSNLQKLEQITLTHKLIEQIQSKKEDTQMDKQDILSGIVSILNDTSDIKSQHLESCGKDLVIDVANIEIQIDTTQRAKPEIRIEKTVPSIPVSDGSDKKDKQKAKDTIVRTFVQQSESNYIIHLLDCVKILSSVSRHSKSTAKMLKNIASPYYVRTLLHLVVNLSQDMKFRVLSVLDDLVEIDVSIVDFQDELNSETPQIYNSCIANFLYNFARECLMSSRSFSVVKQVVKILRRLNIAERHAARIERLMELDSCDQVLSLMICDCGAELESMQPGDQVCLQNNSLPIEQTFKIMKSGKKCHLYSPQTGKTPTIGRQHLRLVRSGEPLCFPQDQIVKNLLLSDQSIPVVKAVLMNLVLRNQDHYSAILPVLGGYIQNFLVSDYMAQRKREVNQWDISVSVFLTEEIEDKAFLNIKEELKKPPASIPTENQEPKEAIRRTLIRSFFKPLKKKLDKYHNTVEECAYYDLFQVRDTVYHLIENPLLKQDMLDKLTKSNIKFPLSYEKYSKLVVRDRVLRVRKIMETWSDQTKFKHCIQNSETLLYRTKFSQNFEFILKNEAPAEFEKKPSIIPIKNCECANLLYQRMSELLFNTYSPPAQIEDDEVLWHLNRYFLQRSAYNFIRYRSSKDLSKRWFEIVNKCDLTWIKLYVKRAIRHGFSDVEVTWDYERESAYFYILQRPMRIIFKLIVARYEDFALEFLADFCEIVLRQLISTRSISYYYYAQSRKNLNMVQSLITLVQQKKDAQVFLKLLQNTLLPNFINQACKSKKMFQFGYVGRLIDVQLQKAQSELKNELGSLGERCLLSDDKFSVMMAEYEKVVKRDSLDLLAQMTESSQDVPVYESFVEVKSEQFGKWQQVKLEDPNSELEIATLQVAVLEGTGVSLVAISDEPTINQSTKYRVVHAGNKTDFISVKIDAKKAAFLIYPVEKSFLLRYKTFKPDLKLKYEENHQFEVDEDCKLFGFDKTTEFRKESWLFAASQQKLYLARDNSNFEEVMGIQGKTKSIIQAMIETDEEFFTICNDQNQYYILRSKDVLKQKHQRKSFYRKTQDEPKVTLVVTSVQNNEGIHTFQAITESNEVLSLVAETVFEHLASIMILRDQHETVTLACEWTNDKKKTLKGDNIYLEIQKNTEPLQVKPFFKKEKNYKSEQKIEFLTWIQEYGLGVFAVVVDGYLDLWSGKDRKVHCKLPEEVEKVNKIHAARSGCYEDSGIFDDDEEAAFFIESTLKESQAQRLYWAIFKKGKTDESGQVLLEFKSAKHQDFKSIYSLHGRVLAIDKDGEIWAFFDQANWFTTEDEKQNNKSHEDFPQIKTTLMKQRMSKATDLCLRSHKYNPNYQNHNFSNQEEYRIFLVVRRLRILTETKTEESFECIAQRNWKAGQMETQITFDLNQIYYRENRSIEQPDHRVMSIISESIQMGCQYFCVRPNNQNVPALKYKVFDPNNPTSLTRNFSDEEIANCKEFLNTELKKTKTKQLQIGLLKKEKQLASFLKTANSNSEGHSPQLVQIMISANQFILSSLPVTRAKAHDYKYSQMQDFISFTSKFALPLIMQLIILKIQKTLAPLKNRSEKKVRFQRLNSNEKLFDQLYRQTSEISTKLFTFRYDPERPFRSRFVGENAYDAGGPFRDVMDDICAELSESFFKPTNNMAVSGESSYQPQVLLDEVFLGKFQYIGKMIGWALRQWNYNLSLDLNPLFWKRICRQPISIEDLKEVDKYRYQMLIDVLAGKYSCTFEVDLGTGTEMLLCEGGQNIEVTPENSQEFVSLYLEKYLEQDSFVHDAIRSGVEEVCPKQILRHLTVQAASDVAFSTPKVTADELLSRIRSEDGFEFPITYQLFSRMIKEFSNKERQLLLKFITGSSRLTNQGHAIQINQMGNAEGGSLEEYLEYPDRNPAHKAYPVGHTCGKSVDLPDYTDFDIMCARFRTAILTCGEIDDDGNYYDSEDDGGEGRGESDNSEDSGENESEDEGEDSSEDEGEDSNSQTNSNQTSQEAQSIAESVHQSQQSRSYRSNSERSQGSSQNEQQFYRNLNFDSDDFDDFNGENGESEESDNDSNDSGGGSGSDESSQRHSNSSSDSGNSNSQQDSGDESSSNKSKGLPKANQSSSDSDPEKRDSEKSNNQEEDGEENSWASADDDEEVDY